MNINESTIHDLRNKAIRLQSRMETGTDPSDAQALLMVTLAAFEASFICYEILRAYELYNTLKARQHELKEDKDALHRLNLNSTPAKKRLLHSLVTEETKTSKDLFQVIGFIQAISPTLTSIFNELMEVK